MSNIADNWSHLSTHSFDQFQSATDIYQREREKKRETIFETGLKFNYNSYHDPRSKNRRRSDDRFRLFSTQSNDRTFGGKGKGREERFMKTKHRASNWTTRFRIFVQNIRRDIRNCVTRKIARGKNVIRSKVINVVANDRSIVHSGNYNKKQRIS